MTQEKLKILCVEDEVDIRENIAEILDDCGRLIKRMDQFEIDKNQYNGKSFKSGIYYLRIQLTNGKNITKLFSLNF